MYLSECSLATLAALGAGVGHRLQPRLASAASATRDLGHGERRTGSARVRQRVGRQPCAQRGREPGPEALAVEGRQLGVAGPRRRCAHDGVNVAMSTWASWPARVVPRQDLECVLRRPCCCRNARPLRDCVDGVGARRGRRPPLMANTIVASTWTRCRRRSTASIAGYVNVLTALAITNPITVSETRDCTAIISFAHGAIGMTSVGLKAVLVVMPRIR